jgi:hypothetical protein
MKTYINLWQSIAQFLHWELIQTKVVEKIKTHIIRSAIFFESHAVHELMWKNMFKTYTEISL